MEEKSLDEYRKERDLIVGEIGEFDEEDFVKSGISLLKEAGFLFRQMPEATDSETFAD